MDHVLLESDLRLVVDELSGGTSGVSTHWYDLGLHLGIGSGKLDRIKRKHCDNELREMIKLWLKKAHPQPCWEAIVTALKKDPLGEERLAQTLWETYCKEEAEDEDEHNDTNSEASLQQLPLIRHQEENHQRSIRKPRTAATKRHKKKKRAITKAEAEDDTNSEASLQQQPQIQHQEGIQAKKKQRHKTKKKAVTKGLAKSQSGDTREGEMESTATQSSETPIPEINEGSPPLQQLPNTQMFSGSTQASNKRTGSSNETDEPRPKRSKQDDAIKISCQSCQEHVFGCKDCLTKIMTMQSRQENESQDEVSCTNTVRGCSWKGKATELVNHRRECPKEEIPCPLSAAGCHAKFLRENDDIHVQKHMLEVQKHTIERLEEAQESFQLRTPPLIFKVENVLSYLDNYRFREEHDNKFQEYSPPFYTHPGGYKMRLCVRVKVSGRESRIEVFPEAMPGKYDKSLHRDKAEVVAMILHHSDKDKHYQLEMGQFEFERAQNVNHSMSNSVLGIMVFSQGLMKISGFSKATVNIKRNESDSAKEPSILREDYLIGGGDLYIQVSKVDIKYVKPWLLTPTPLSELQTRSQNESTYFH